MPGSIGRGVAGGEDPGVALALLGGELARPRRVETGAPDGMDQQVVLGEEAGEQHAVPLLVGDLLDQQRRAVGADAATEGLGPLAQGGAQVALLRRQDGRGAPAASAPRRASVARAAASARPRARDDRLLEVAAELGRRGVASAT